MNTNSTSFKQYKYCSLCKVNHNTGKKHVYSKRHQLILKNILQKFQTKIQQVKGTLFSPVAKDLEYEAGAKFWCYFCAIEVDKHDIMESCKVLGYGLLQHIASDEHKAGLEQFFWDNLVKKEMKPRYVLSIEDLSIFKKAAFLAVKKYQKASEADIKQAAFEIAAAETRRQEHLSESNQSKQITSQLEANTGNQSTTEAENQSISARGVKQSAEMRWPISPGKVNQSAKGGASRDGKQPGKRTVLAHGEGLSCISQPGGAEDGNVHSGAMPPWLLNDTPTSRGEIGPTLEDYQKHLHQEKRAKLPAMRVGANFDHQGTADTSWLPSFGRVWSKGRRLQSKQHFEKEWKKTNGKPQPSSTVTAESKIERIKSSTPPWEQPSCSRIEVIQDGSQSANQVQPYKKKLKQTVIDSEIDSDWTKQSAGKMPANIVPYKRKSQHFGTPDNKYVKMQTNTDQRFSSSSEVVPTGYKRQRKEHDNASSSSNLIQTPVLNLQL
ncbi:centrosomal AT-AC splicing factor-like [Mya arenaria]|uniref:centrosomal AT-AC splicing factor-like n=1 Tax=Mya arenaria TaxID=6604 RepID=UPI0022E6D69F|nr:centrosomal AT-AC splicing factor-like [Mya arenaria]